MTPAPRVLRPLRSGPLWGGLAGAFVLSTVALRDPHVPGSYGTCPLLAATGLPCAGCGGLRATHDLLHGDVPAAVGQNALAVVVVVLAVALWARWAWRSARGADRTAPSPVVPSSVLLASGAAVVLFTLVRWTPAGGALGP